MITEEKIKVFEKYAGDIDSWVRGGSKKEKLIMTDDDWYTIDSLMQDLFLVKKGLASSEFKNALNSKLIEKCDGESTVNQLEKLADSSV